MTTTLPAAPAPVIPVASGSLSGGRCRVMGILNVTPDSFSDGGRYLDHVAAVARGFALVGEGADLVDVGGESTRPGAARVDEDEELRRVVPVVEALCRAGVTVSVDTMRASVAERALEAGATLVNDVSGGLADPRMLPMIAATGARCVLMHWRAHSETMEQHATYRSVVPDVRDELARRVDAALAAGVSVADIVLDPGLGFAKTAAQTWALLAGLPALHELGLPVLVGASRKRFLAECVSHDATDATCPAARDDASAAVAALAAASGAWGVRVHEPAAAAAAVRVARRIAEAREHGA